MDYLTIDFETANENFTSACSIGIIAMENGKIKWEKYYLINPEEPFNYENTLIHGITDYMTENAPTFDKVWEEIKDDFNNVYVFAHNVSFDIRVLKSMIEKYNLEAPSIKYGDTLRIAQKIFKDEVPNCRLGTLSNFFQIEHNHHNALSDALVCTVIIEKALLARNLSTIQELYDLLDLRFGIYNKTTFTTSAVRHKEKKKVKENPLKNKIFCMSGKGKLTHNKIKEMLAQKGAFVDNSLSMATDYFISMTNTPKKKTKEVLLLISKGAHIEIIDEKKLTEMIGEKNEEN